MALAILGAELSWIWRQPGNFEFGSPIQAAAWGLCGSRSYSIHSAT